MPHSTSAPRLGDLERVVMEHLWDAASMGGPTFGGATVREVLDRFEGEREIAYTTVMTVLDRLAKKDLVTRERDGRAWRYLPADTREALTARTMRRTLDDMEVTDRRTALLHFLDRLPPTARRRRGGAWPRSRHAPTTSPGASGGTGRRSILRRR